MTLIASHRGGTHLWPENSRLAFNDTTRLPVAYVEFDVHQTSDNVLVVHHDATIDRMTDGTGPIAAMSFEELRRHVIIGAAGETVPTLDEVLEIFKPSSVDLRLELKTAPDQRPYPGMEERVVRCLAEQGMLGRSLVTSFAIERLVAFREAHAASAGAREAVHGYVWLVSPMVQRLCGAAGVVATAAAHRIEGLGLHHAMIDAALAADLRQQGLRLHAWAAHSKAAARRMFELGVESFTSDRPDLALAAQAELGRDAAQPATGGARPL
jgi:glycerophosphoryl diester phosphodiesterase